MSQHDQHTSTTWDNNYPGASQSEAGGTLAPGTNPNFIPAMTLPEQVDYPRRARQLGIIGVVGLLNFAAGIGVGMNLNHGVTADENHQSDVPAVAEAQKPGSTLELSAEDIKSVNKAAVQAALSRIDTVRQLRKQEQYPSPPFMGDSGQLFFLSSQTEAVKNQPYDRKDTDVDIVARSQNTTDGLRIEVDFSDTAACYKTTKGDLESADCDYKQSASHSLTFLNKDSKIFNDRKLTVGELEKYLKDPETRFVEATKGMDQYTKGSITKGTYAAGKIENGQFIIEVATTGGDPNEVLTDLTNVG